MTHLSEGPADQLAHCRQAALQDGPGGTARGYVAEFEGVDRQGCCPEGAAHLVHQEAETPGHVQALLAGNLRVALKAEFGVLSPAR
ncbi:UNVERIFIED_ORG: hypothetical protein J2W38_007552 [Variovorax paradoxus]|nr:hypothetical protein [Variovorax paradoxus]